MRREELCDVNLCPDSPEDGGRCEKRPLERLDASEQSEAGQLLRQELDLRTAFNIGVSLSLDVITANEFFSMLIIEEEQDRLGREQAPRNGQQ